MLNPVKSFFLVGFVFPLLSDKSMSWALLSQAQNRKGTAHQVASKKSTPQVLDDAEGIGGSRSRFSGAKSSLAFRSFEGQKNKNLSQKKMISRFSSGKIMKVYLKQLCNFLNFKTSKVETFFLLSKFQEISSCLKPCLIRRETWTVWKTGKCCRSSSNKLLIAV